MCGVSMRATWFRALLPCDFWMPSNLEAIVHWPCIEDEDMGSGRPRQIFSNVFQPHSSSCWVERTQPSALDKICVHCQGRICIAWACTLEESSHACLFSGPPRTSWEGLSVPVMIESTVTGDVDSLVGRIMLPRLGGSRPFEHEKHAR